MARKRLEKGSSARDAAFNIQQHARDQADEEARPIPWQLLQEARRLYIAWQEFCFWARSVMESEGSLPSWLAAEIEDRCPGFLEGDSRYSTEHPSEGFLTPVRLGFWIDDHLFEFAKKGGWFNAMAYYTVREPRYQNECLLVSISRRVEACARLMGLEPDRVPHIHEASHFLGNSSPAFIDQAGEALRGPQVPFQVVPEFRHLADFLLPSPSLPARNAKSASEPLLERGREAPGRMT